MMRRTLKPAIVPASLVAWRWHRKVGRDGDDGIVNLFPRYASRPPSAFAESSPISRGAVVLAPHDHPYLIVGPLTTLYVLRLASSSTAARARALAYLRP